jgi:hypothetical protein
VNDHYHCNYHIKLTQSQAVVSQLDKDVAGVAGVADVAKRQPIINVSCVIILIKIIILNYTSTKMSVQMLITSK